MISINNLSFYYNKRKSVFDNVSLELGGGIYGLLGENGVGKTTLLHIISGLSFPKKGTCKILGSDSYSRNPEAMAQLFYLPEEFQVPSISIKDYVKYDSTLYPNFSETLFNVYLHDFQLDISQRMNELSFGQKKKVLIAYALALNTPITLLDEPTNGLDIPSKAQFRKAIAAAYDENRCIIISTHQVRDLESLIDPIIILDSNRVLLHNTVDEITRKLLFSYTSYRPQEALYCEQTMQGYTSVQINEYNEESTLNIEALFNAVIRNKDKMKDLFNA